MKAIETERARLHDMSPQVSPEERMKHDLEAEKFNYSIALSELSSYKEHSKLQAAPGRGAKSEHSWTDHQGRVWVTENTISLSVRKEMKMVLHVIRNYEARHGERSREEQALDEIVSLRTAGREHGPDRLAQFDKQAVQPNSVKSTTRIDSERIFRHGMEKER